MSLMLSALFCAVSIMAQSSAGDKIYNEGMALQSRIDCKSQKAAIDKFKKAKKFYDSSMKKSQCDNAIQVSQNIISQLNCNGPKSNVPTPQKSNRQPKLIIDDITLDLDKSLFEIPENATEIDVTVNTNCPDWSIYTVTMDEDDPFIKVERISGSRARITVERNASFDTRSQYANVKAGALMKPITVRQEGSPVNLHVNEAAVKFKWKGGDKKLVVSSNYDGSYKENYGANWYVDTKPDWLMVSVGQPKKSAANPMVMETPITIKCDKAAENSTPALVGRKGYILFHSGKTIFKLEVWQERK